ncbi:iron-containing redox enzyme family protein [Salinisphaera sp. SPP-AMP-43]|uniref:iron-containing redox enzyme family protein n=1 Tax=Salinisphaera sp. SPP-AMP-43 TaxID=3121288 RepID=UPI003C6E5F88
MFTHKDLFLANRSELSVPNSMPDDMRQFELAWIDRSIHKTSGESEMPSDLANFRTMLANLIDADAADEPETASFVATDINLDQFRTLVQEFAVDGLTEAQIFWPVMPRLSLAAQMPMMRMMIDEFGSGNPVRAHTNLYINLLKELDMRTDLQYYIDVSGDAIFEFANMYYWMVLRARDTSFFVGALTYFETMIPTFFDCYVKACERLGVQEHAYYSEHVHIDEFHAAEGHRILRAMDKDGDFSPDNAWRGVLLGRHLTMSAFDAAVDKSRDAIAA